MAGCSSATAMLRKEKAKSVDVVQCCIRPKLFDVISCAVLPNNWRRHPPDMEGSCEFIE